MCGSTYDVWLRPGFIRIGDWRGGAGSVERWRDCFYSVLLNSVIQFIIIHKTDISTELWI